MKVKVETLDKKVESLVKFLENERRLRHELEHTLKHKHQELADITSKTNELVS